MAWLLVALGGALGAVARWFLQEALSRQSQEWPVSTFAINLSGCFLIALFAGAAGEHTGLHPGWRLLFPIGFVGAYTTFSTFELETWRLIERGAWLNAASYVIGSNALGLLAVFAGLWLGRRL